MSRGRSGRRSRRTSSIGIPGMRPGDSFKSSHSHGGSGVSIFVAFVIWMTLFGIVVFGTRPEKVTDSPPPVSTDEVVVTTQRLPQLNIPHESWKSFERCLRWKSGTEGEVSFGNMTINLIGSASNTYNFKVTANGFEPIFIDISYIGRPSPEKDSVAYTTYILMNGTPLELDSQFWEHPEWRYREVIFTTTSGEIGVISFGDTILYGVGTSQTEEFCSN